MKKSDIAITIGVCLSFIGFSTATLMSLAIPAPAMPTNIENIIGTTAMICIAFGIPLIFLGARYSDPVI
jgi:hypothetical protein